MPALSGWARERTVARIKSAFPAVTCTAQSDYLTGRYPGAARHRRQRLVRARGRGNQVLEAVQPARAGAKIWETARAADPSFTCANLFWWFNMYSTADYSVTPRPMYPADGRKMPDVYTTPPALRDELQSELGNVSAVRVLGTARRHSIDAVDRRRRQARGTPVQPDADADLPAASRLQPAAGRPGIRPRRPTCRQIDARLRRSDSSLRIGRRTGDRALGVRTARRLLPRSISIACCASTD